MGGVHTTNHVETTRRHQNQELLPLHSLGTRRVRSCAGPAGKCLFMERATRRVDAAGYGVTTRPPHLRAETAAQQAAVADLWRADLMMLRTTSAPPV